VRADPCGDLRVAQDTLELAEQCRGDNQLPPQRGTDRLLVIE